MSHTVQENDFDRRAEAIFKTIPAETRAANPKMLVSVYPDADPSKGELYVLGDTLGEVLKRADARFGLGAQGKLMSFTTDDGSLPKDYLLRGLRGLK